ncbi:hypothetical protein D7B24_007585 [Verticillium nonalfalfae]|uniref:Uncharacterized protein n=1 Tax=Verticillium nonalfalfae TaxID=1051616 RepID=A0A3M9Y845_9PEZI|nr:uncharacterized protein D7B24_007585 [Verticillium nonalfalfae]RNJ56202.1 hypothetical protein D7B24_007585 [Verticillium nonalfalfae]
MSDAGRDPTGEEMNDLLSAADNQGPGGNDDLPAEEAEPGPEALERAQPGSIADAVAAGTHADDDPIDSNVTDDGIVEISDDEEEDDDDDMSDDDEPDHVRALRERIKQLRAGVIGLRDEKDGLINDKEQLSERIRGLDAMIETLQANNNQLRNQLNRSRHPRQRTQRTWPAMLRAFLAGDPMAEEYHVIYRRMCEEENMSTKSSLLHPNLKLREPDDEELAAQLLNPDGDAPGENNEMGDNPVDHRAARNGVGEVVTQATHATDTVDEELFVVETKDNQKERPRRSFDSMPPEVQAKIVRLVLEYPGRLVHCISRLDPHCEPRAPLPHTVGRGSSNLPKRFWTGRSGTCSIEYATKPNDMLSILLVSKSVHFLGVHAFYGLNTFAFSSLGEFGRFCRGIGSARAQRIQHIEILWQGNQTLTFTPTSRGQWTSRRTYDTSELLKMRRLKTVVIHIDESSRGRRRRPHELPAVRTWLAGKTKLQPNHGNFRALRTLQGQDYIYGLRGIRHILFYDIEKYRTMGGRHPIRD